MLEETLFYTSDIILHCTDDADSTDYADIYMCLCFDARCHNVMSMFLLTLKPQDSFGEFRKCRKSSENTSRSSCNCFELHTVMQYCPVANYHYVHNLWQECSGGPQTFLCFGYFLKMEAFWSELLTGH